MVQTASKPNMTNHPNRGLGANPAKRPSPEEIRAAREAAGHTQAEAALVIHATKVAWQKWEYGERTMHPAFFELYQLKTQKQEKIMKQVSVTEAGQKKVVAWLNDTHKKPEMLRLAAWLDDAERAWVDGNSVLVFEIRSKDSVSGHTETLMLDVPSTDVELIATEDE